MWEGCFPLPRAVLPKSPNSRSPGSSSGFSSCLLFAGSPGCSTGGLRRCLPPSPEFQAGIGDAHSPDLWFGEAAVRPVPHVRPPQGPECVGWAAAAVWAGWGMRLVQRLGAREGTRRTLGSLGNAAEPPGCVLGSPHPCNGCCCVRAKGNSSCPAISQGTEQPHIPKQPGKRQFVPSFALPQQGFPVGSRVPMPTRSHRLQQIPFPWGHPSPAERQAGACKDCHRLIPPTQGHAPGLGGSPGTRGLVQGPVPRCQPCPATRLHA